MAPTTVTQKLAALSLTHVENNFDDTDSLESDDGRETTAGWGGASTGNPRDEKRDSRAVALSESWADMEDDVPFFGRPGDSKSGAAVASRDRPISTELSRGLLLFEAIKPPEVCKPLLLEAIKPREVCKPPAEVSTAVGQGVALPVGHRACGPVPQEAAAARTPLSSKSRPFAPFVPVFYPAVPPGCQWEVAVPFGVPATPMDDKGKAGVKTEEEEWTTVMLCGFPRDFNRDKLVNLLGVSGYAGQFDFVYLPMDFEYSESVGYAFVNLTTAAAALRLKASLEGSVGHPFTDEKPCKTNWSRVQGLGANLKQYRNSPVMHKLVPDEFKPMILWNGQPQPFPEPTAALKQLRPHRKKDRAVGTPTAPQD